MSTFFPAGGPDRKAGAWWRVLHSAIDAGAELGALRLIHVAGVGAVDEDNCEKIVSQLGEDAACVIYDSAALLVIEPGVEDIHVINAVQTVFNVTAEQIRLWRATTMHRDGLEFSPIAVDSNVPTDVSGIVAQDNTLRPHGLVLTDAEFRYMPLWDVTANEIFCYVCENTWNTGTDEQVSEDALNAFFSKTRHVFALDRAALHKAIAQAQDFLDRYIFTQILIPVHYSTITLEVFAQPYLDSCNQDVWPVIDSIYFEITKIPTDVNAEDLSRAIESLSTFAQKILLQFDSGFCQFDAISTDGVYSVGLDFRYDERPHEEIHAELEAFAIAAQDLGLLTHVHNLQGMDACVSAGRLGYDFISSTTVAPPLDIGSPEVEMVSSSDLLRSIMSK